MILIFSELYDSSTNVVIDYLSFNKKEFYRINEDLPIEYVINKRGIKILNPISINLIDINSVWFRRSIARIKKELIKSELKILAPLLNEHSFSIQEYLNYSLSTKNRIGGYDNFDVNKLIVSHIAKEVGLRVPKSYLGVGPRNINAERTYITKLLTGNSNIETEEGANLVFPVKLLNDIDKITRNTYFQEYISKKYELRIFYLKGKCYAMTIFTQRDSKTKIDYRRYNKQIPNRTVPYLLPSAIENKIETLMNKLKLNTGSIDMIVTPEDEYYFLEVNPVGQFGMVSFPCNYNLEEKIANIL